MDTTNKKLLVLGAGRGHLGLMRTTKKNGSLYGGDKFDR